MNCKSLYNSSSWASMLNQNVLLFSLQSHSFTNSKCEATQTNSAFGISALCYACHFHSQLVSVLSMTKPKLLKMTAQHVECMYASRISKAGGGMCSFEKQIKSMSLLILRNVLMLLFKPAFVFQNDF